MIAQGDFPLCKSLWEDISYSKIIVASDEDIQRIRQLKLNMDDLKHFGGKLKDVITDRGFDITPFKNMLNEYIHEDRLRNSKIDLGIVTVNLSDLKATEIFVDEIPYGMVKDYLLASAFLPVFKNEKIGGKHYIDGGVHDNLPYRMLSNRGYKKLILVRTHPGEETIIKDDTLEEIIIITPSDSIGRSFTYEKDICSKNIKLGYHDGLRAIKGLMGNQYYFYPKGDKFYYDYLFNLSDEKIDRLIQFFNLHGSNRKRAIFEEIIPKIASFMDLKKDSSYEIIVLALIELIAVELEIERFKVYVFEDIIHQINKNKTNDVYSNKERFNSILRKIESLNYLNKEEVLMEVSSILFGNRFGR